MAPKVEPAIQAQPGDKHKYNPQHGKGMGEEARGTDLVSDMADLDLTPETEVIFAGADEDSGWPIIEWTDDAGNPRLTTVHPGTFDSDFAPVT